MSSQRLVGIGHCQIKPCDRRGGGECAILPESSIKHCKKTPEKNVDPCERRGGGGGGGGGGGESEAL